MNPIDPEPVIPCPDCPGLMVLNEKNRYHHFGPHSADCPWRKYEPINWDGIEEYNDGKWEFDENGELQRTTPPKVEQSPISQEQFENNVIKVDFKNKKRIE